MSSILPKPLPFLTEAKLTPGLQFGYQVRAEKGGFGDFPNRFPFELHGQWLVRATITDQTEVARNEVHGGFTTGAKADERIAGHEALFRVYLNEDNVEEPLQLVSGVILPRPLELKRPEWFGTHPLEQGYATALGRVMINGEKPVGGMRFVIPARNITQNSLFVTGDESG